ncbi:MAG TPA: PD-(D/E)XK nuclease family protein [Candidatus Levybacteria bacterium]|nr:PD-(D/E)XK nuclease family protein [Candidatus Levybacteria bacterium]
MQDKKYKLSPSDFGYLWNDCKHCYYHKVKYGIASPGIFPSMFGRINKLLQDSIMGNNLNSIHPELPSGIISIQEGFLRSIPIPGATNCYIQGRFDILTRLDDGTYTVIDFKITPPDEEKLLDKYSSQLHAYKFALENPEKGDPVQISKLGIVSVNPEEMRLEGGKIIFTAVPRYHEVKTDMNTFYSLISDISKVLEGDKPLPTESCGLCRYRAYFMDSGSEEDIPF